MMGEILLYFAEVKNKLSNSGFKVSEAKNLTPHIVDLRG
jgi:hypothetical protein